MKDINLSSMISLAQEVFDIFKNEYKDFLSYEKKDFLLNLDVANFFKVIEDDTKPFIYFLGDTYYLNISLSSQLKSLDENNHDLYTKYLMNNDINGIFNDLVIFMCLSLFCGELNPLKIGLMEREIRHLSQKYSLKTSPVNSYKELEIAEVVSEGLLNDVPFNIIFLDTDSEIFNYLVEEKGSRVASFYYQISELMKAKYNKFSKDKFNIREFINYYNTIDYQDVSDLIYNFISTMVR